MKERIANGLPLAIRPAWGDEDRFEVYPIDDDPIPGSEPTEIAEVRGMTADPDDERAEAYAFACLFAAAPKMLAALKELDWHSPYETPHRGQGANATRVLVKLELVDNPPALNAPPKYAFGHRIVRDDPTQEWPEDGWFFDGQGSEYSVTAWRHIEPPEEARDAIAAAEQEDAA